MWLKKTKTLALAVLIIVPPYVLPYPGLMPGNKLYPLKQIVDYIGQFWGFGSFARHKYELALADKKLVEAKTLFEYQQYPLALEALSDSNGHFDKAEYFLTRGEKERKDISQKRKNLQAAAVKHKEVLEKLKVILPEKLIWQPEKKPPQELLIKDSLEEAIKIREI